MSLFPPKKWSMPLNAIKVSHGQERLSPRTEMREVVSTQLRE